MKRSDFLLTSAIIGAGAMLPLRKLELILQTPFQTIRRNVGTFVMRGGTIGWLANRNSLVVVDSQYPASAQSCLEGLKTRTGQGMLDYLINTHHHGDHTAGNTIFKGFARHILAHDNVPALQKAAAERRGKETLEAQVYPDLTYRDTWVGEVGEETVHLSYRGPAHTGGDSVVYFEKANVAHMGDLVFNRAYPFIDLRGGANIANWVKSLRSTASDLPSDAIYIFGHGNPEFGITGSQNDVLVMSDFLEALLEYTREGIQKGMSLEELTSAEIIPGFEDFNAPGWGLKLSTNIEAAYTELTSS